MPAEPDAKKVEEQLKQEAIKTVFLNSRSRWADSTLACSTGGRETVQASSYSKVLGIPVALLGLGAYTAIFLCSLLKNDVARAAAFSTALAGVAFAAYLLYVQLAAIDAVCEWCLASDAFVTMVAVLTLLRLRAADWRRCTAR